MVSAAEIAALYPFYKLDDIQSGSLNTRDEGYYNAPLMVEWLIRKSLERGVEYVRNRVTAVGRIARLFRGQGRRRVVEVPSAEILSFELLPRRINSKQSSVVAVSRDEA